MIRWLSVVLCALTLALPACALAGNHAPKLSLEVYRFVDVPDPLPPGICVHDLQDAQYPLSCYAPRVVGNYYYVPLHVGALDHPICPTHGAPVCFGYGGYEGVGFGVLQTAPTGHPLACMSWNACPGFLKGPSIAGVPAACLASSTTGTCHDWYEHEGYLVFLNASSYADKVYFEVVDSADLGHHRVINCVSTYDYDTTVSGLVQVGGTQDVVCPDPTAVKVSTWGQIKTIYR